MGWRLKVELIQLQTTLGKPMEGSDGTRIVDDTRAWD